MWQVKSKISRKKRHIHRTKKDLQKQKQYIETVAADMNLAPIFSQVKCSMYPFSYEDTEKNKHIQTCTFLQVFSKPEWRMMSAPLSHRRDSNHLQTSPRDHKSVNPIKVCLTSMELTCQFRVFDKYNFHIRDTILLWAGQIKLHYLKQFSHKHVCVFIYLF